MALYNLKPNISSMAKTIMPRVPYTQLTAFFSITKKTIAEYFKDEKLIESEIERKLGIGDFKNKGLA